MRSVTVNHHPRAETLAAYAAGALDEALSVVVATHATLCDACKVAIGDFEAVGGFALETVEPAAMKPSALETFWLLADDAPGGVLPASTRAANDFAPEAAQPLRKYLRGGVDAANWKPLTPGLSQHVLKADGYRPGVLRLLRIMPGTQIPPHAHRDTEFTLILRGAYEDEIGRFATGDFADLGEEDRHSPVAVGDEPCICLIATNAPLAFKSVVGRIVQPFIGL